MKLREIRDILNATVLWGEKVRYNYFNTLTRKSDGHGVPWPSAAAVPLWPVLFS